MCSKEERERRIREMMAGKLRAKTAHMEAVVEKITAMENENSQLIENSYGIQDPNICPQIAEGEQYIKTLPDELTAALVAYTGSGYTDINQSLRGGASRNRGERNTNTSLLNLVPKIDKAFLTAPPLTHPMTVYRGVSGLDKLRDDNGFSSCSLKKDISNGFGGGKVFEILLPIGTRVLFVKPISCVRGEDEVLLDRSGEFREVIPGKLVYMSHLE